MSGVDFWSRCTRAAQAFSAFLIFAVLGCRSPSNTALPVPDAEHVTPSPPAPEPTKPLRVEATVTRYLAIGWAHVLDVDLAGDLNGDAQLYVPAGDPGAKAIIPIAASSGSKLRLQLEPLPGPDAGSGGPYELHLVQRGDGGTTYWKVKGVEVEGR